MDFKESTLMYALGIGVVLFVTAQSLFFMIKAWRRAREIGIESAKLRQTVISSALFSLAPAVSILATVLALASALGIVLPWIRLSVIGNLAYETVAAENALDVLGASLSREVTNPKDFSAVAWTMTIGSCFPLILLPFLCQRVHKLMGKAVTKSKSAGALGDVLGAAAFIGIIAAFIARCVAGKPSNGPSSGFMSVSVLLSAMIFTIALDYLCRKKQLKKLEPFVLPLAMFGAMGIAVLFVQLLPAEITQFVWR